MTEKILFLAPECYKLWAIRPGLCFLYDKITIDTFDYNDILASSEESTYNSLLARNVERLRMEGILESRSYETLLPPETRIKIHQHAGSYVDNLPEDKRLELAKYAHDEYKEYLKSQLLFCQSEEPKFKTLTERLSKVKKRIFQLNADRMPTEETDETLKRITAKSLAGTYIVSQVDGAHLYDTSEYRPFIDTISIDEILSDRAEIQHHDRAEDKAVDIVAALVLNKRLPDITVYDDHSLTTFLQTREDLSILRSLIEEVLIRYHDLIKADPDVAHAHLEKSFKNALEHLNNELSAIRKRTGLLWKITEILASLKHSIIKPFLKPLYDANIQKYRENEIQKLAKKDKLLADLLFVFDKVRFGDRRHEIAHRRTFPEPKETEKILWGQDGLMLPWYERE